MGWSESAVEKLIATYAHEIGALDAIDAAFAAVPDANPTHAKIPPQLATVDEVCPPL
jgi:hypothetical protein